MLICWLWLTISTLLWYNGTSEVDPARFEVDVAWEFDTGDRGGWGNATSEEMQMDLRVENHELRASITGWEPSIDSPPLVLDVTRRHYVAIRMMYYGGADTAQLMLKSGPNRMDRDRIDWGESYWWTTRLPKADIIRASHEVNGYPKENAVDEGVSGTSWMANIDALNTPYIDLDFKTRLWVTSVRLTVPNGDSSPKRCYLQRSRVHSTGPFETVGDFLVSNSSNGESQWFGGINAYGRYWRLRIMTNHGAATTGLTDIELHGADEEVAIAPFEVHNVLDNKGKYKNYYIPIHQFLSGQLLRMRLKLFTSATNTQSDQRVRAHMQYREGLAIDYIRIVRAPEIWRVRGCIDVYSTDVNFQDTTYDVSPRTHMIGGHLPLSYWDKNDMDTDVYRYAKTFDCPVEGGVEIRIDGLNFGPNARVFIGSNPNSHTLNETAYGSNSEPDHGRGKECIVQNFYRDDPDNKGRVETLICTLPPGSAGTKYVRVENENMPGIFQEAPFFAYRVAPPVPRLPTLANVAAHRVDLLWDPPGSEIEQLMVTGYKILWFSPTTRSQINNLTVGNVHMTSVRGLSPGTEYVFAIAAVSEGAYHERSASLPTDLYGRRDLTGNAMVGTFSAYTNVTLTKRFDIDYGTFDANGTAIATFDGSETTLRMGGLGPSAKGPTGQVGGEGNYGIVLVGHTNVQNCNSSSTCCDGYNVTKGPPNFGCGHVCSTVLERRLAHPLSINGVTRREVPANIPYVNWGDQEKVIFPTLQSLRDFIYPSTVNGYELSACGPALRMTAAEARQSGSAWYNRKMNVGEGFDTTFKFEISNPSIRCDRLDDVNTYCRSRGADGIAFVLQDEDPVALGDAGRGLGYEGIFNALAIELDTYSNFDQMDPYENHISIMTQGWRYNISANHSRSLADTTRIPDLTDGIHTVRIRYDPNFEEDAVPHPSFSTSGYTTWFLENADFQYGGQGDWGTGFGLLYVYIDDLYSPVLTTPLNLDATLKMDDGRMYVGLTSATGNSNWQAHDILEWQFRSLYIDRLYEAPIVVNGEGAHECVNETACVHTNLYERAGHYVRTNNIYDGTYNVND